MFKKTADLAEYGSPKLYPAYASSIRSLKLGEFFILLFAVLKVRVNILLPTARNHGKGALIEFIFISPFEHMDISDLVLVIMIIVLIIMIMIAIFRIICELLSANIWCDVQ